MNVTCEDCRTSYDDTYHLTTCPHPYFDMHTVVVRPGKPDAVATTLEELDRLMA